ncbi:MAG TPA: ATP synthase F1 subunit delta [Candidatus Methylomirabilis sp.]|nr:ATP synthase F1 subunit delta [Candidatus Methylomirabilis sp.]
MIAGSVAKRYAKALVEVAGASDELEAVRRELADFADLLRGHREFRLFVANPSVQRRDKAAVFEQIVTALGFRTLTTTFLRILMQAGRLEGLESILRAYVSLVDERLGRVKALVITATPLPSGQEEHLRQRLAEVTGKQVYLEVRDDPSILGGLITQIGSRVYDGSVRTQLRRLREQLAQGI